MATYFLDTSALVKRYIRETGSDWVLALTDPTAGNDLHMLRLAEIEAVSAIVRRSRSKTIKITAATTALADLTYDFQNQYQILELNLGLVQTARSLIQSHGLRAYDAVHLATALELHDMRAAHSLSPITFLCSDNALNSAATAEGLLTDDPISHP